MRRISRVASSSVRGKSACGFARTASVFSRGLSTPATQGEEERPLTRYEVTNTGVRVHAHGVEYDMDFLGGLNADEKNILSGNTTPVTTISEYSSRWGTDNPELSGRLRELDSLINQIENGEEVRASRSEAYLRDINVQSILDRSSSRDVSPVELALGQFWNAYSEVPSPSGKPLRNAPTTTLQRVKSLLSQGEKPQDYRAQTAAIAKYVQAKSVDEKVEAAVALLGPKGRDLSAALKGVTDSAKKEQLVKQHLQWDEATKEAAELTQRHPEFTELQEVLKFFPAFPNLIGEPSKAAYKYKHLVDASFKKWLQSNKLSRPEEVFEKDPLLKSLRGQIFTGKSTADAKKAQDLQRAFPSLLYTRDSESFANFLNQDQEVKNQLSSLSKESAEENPSDPSSVVAKDFEKSVTLWYNQSSELIQLQQEWLDSKLARIDARIQDGLVEMDKFVNGTVDDILAEHPEWEKAIEEDIANHRWDPEMDVKDHDRAVHHYYEHHSQHA